MANIRIFSEIPPLRVNYLCSIFSVHHQRHHRVVGMEEEEGELTDGQRASIGERAVCLPALAGGDMEIGVVERDVLVVVHTEVQRLVGMEGGIRLQGLVGIDDTEHGGCGGRARLMADAQGLLRRGEGCRCLQYGTGLLPLPPVEIGEGHADDILGRGNGIDYLRVAHGGIPVEEPRLRGDEDGEDGVTII